MAKFYRLVWLLLVSNMKIGAINCKALNHPEYQVPCRTGSGCFESICFKGWELWTRLWQLLKVGPGSLGHQSFLSVSKFTTVTSGCQSEDGGSGEGLPWAPLAKVAPELGLPGITLPCRWLHAHFQHTHAHTHQSCDDTKEKKNHLSQTLGQGMDNSECYMSVSITCPPLSHN